MIGDETYISGAPDEPGSWHWYTTTTRSAKDLGVDPIRLPSQQAYADAHPELLILPGQSVYPGGYDGGDGEGQDDQDDDQTGGGGGGDGGDGDLYDSDLDDDQADDQDDDQDDDEGLPVWAKVAIGAAGIYLASRYL